MAGGAIGHVALIQAGQHVDLVTLGAEDLQIAPLFNELIGNANFKRKAKLSTIIKFLTIVRLSYPSFKTTLDDALKTVQRANMNRIAISNLRDLKKLLVFFIPVVSHSNVSNITEMSVCIFFIRFGLCSTCFDLVILLIYDCG